MTTRAGYKQTEVGLIPRDWDTVQLGDMNPFVTSGSRGWATFYSDRGKPFIRITNMSRGCIYLDLSDLRLVELPPSASEGLRTALREGDVLISITADIGIIAYVTAKVPTPSYINQHIAIVRFDPAKVDGRFVAYFLASEGPQKGFQALTDTGAKAGMSLLTVRKVLTALPTLEEQRAIAEALSDADEWIASLDRLIAKKRDIKQATMQQLLTGKNRLPGFGKKKGFKQTGIGHIPADWELVPLSDLLDFKNGLNAQKEAYGHGTPFINVLEVIKNTHLLLSDVPGKISAGADALNQYAVRPGDILFNRTSETQDEVGLAAVYSDSKTVVFGGFVIRGRPTSQRLDSHFSGYGLRAPSVRKQIIAKGQGAVRANIGQSDLSDVMFPLPTIEEQFGIAEMLSCIDVEVALLKAQRDKARAVKQGMMQELLTGRVRLM